MLEARGKGRVQVLLNYEFKNLGISDIIILDYTLRKL